MAHVYGRGRDLEWTSSEDVYVHTDHIELVLAIKIQLSHVKGGGHPDLILLSPSAYNEYRFVGGSVRYQTAGPAILMRGCMSWATGNSVTHLGHLALLR